MLESALNTLRSAYDALGRTPGGDFGGFRAKANADIASAATTILGGINSANAAFLEGRREGSPICTSFP